MEIIDIPLFNEDFYNLALLFSLNIIILTIIVKLFYLNTKGTKHFVFTFYMVSMVVFFMCFTLQRYQLDVGLAIGLFAIFGIIRYRTISIQIREMTYLFIVIGISIMNAFASSKLSLTEIFFANASIVALLGFIECVWKIESPEKKNIVYENLENIKPENYDVLKTDLENRTGLTITKIKIKDIDFVKQLVKITITYENRA